LREPTLGTCNFSSASFQDQRDVLYSFIDTRNRIAFVNLQSLIA